MNERAQLAWLARRVAFGLAPGQLDEWEAKGVSTVLDELVDPDANGIEPAIDPFDGLTRERVQGQNPIRDTIVAWVDSVGQAKRPLETWMQFFWHDYFAVSASVVQVPGPMFDHFTLMREKAMGNFGELLHDMSIDAAMLVFLDGRTSTGTAPNENYGRELLELYSVGVGNFTEDDVKAAAVALTGWVVQIRRRGAVAFVNRRHDDTPQTLLGVDGVHDLESVMDVVVNHPATALRVTQLLANKILGPGADPTVVTKRALAFGETLELRPLVRGLLEDGLDGAGSDVVIEPFPWLISCMRATQAQPPARVLGASLRSAGQIPFLPPNVGGFPPPSSYFSTSATVARFNLASIVAAATRLPSPLTEAAEQGDLDALADNLGLVDGFSAATAAALSNLDQPTDRLAAALASPDLIVA